MKLVHSTVAVILLLSVSCGVADDGSNDEVSSRIDTRIRDAWNEAEVEPPPRCSDEQFVRRTYLNLAGRIPTRAQRHAFLTNDLPEKRIQLIDALLDSDKYAIRFADMFDALLMGREDDSKYEQRRKAQWNAYLRRVFRENRPWNEVVAEILLARPESQDDRGSVWFLYERNNEYQKIAEAVAPAFFGIRIECAQCHDHMVATEIEQAHYWGLVAFFNRSKNAKSPNGPRVGESAIGGFSEFAGLDGDSHPNLLTFFRATTVEENRPSADEKQKDAPKLYTTAALKGDPKIPLFSRRERFVEDVVKGHPLIARAFVNRVWAILMGRGIVHPFDEMDSVHPPSHPELLDELALDFKESGYNIRRLVRNIATSELYGLSSIPPQGADDPSTFAWFLPRALTAEQFAASVEVVLTGRVQPDSGLTKKIRRTLVDVLPEEEITTIGEALFLTNNEALNDYIQQCNGDEHLIPQLLQAKDHKARIRQLMLTVFGRLPTPTEQNALSTYLSDESRDLKTSIEHAVWSLLTSAEFRFNH